MNRTAIPGGMTKDPFFASLVIRSMSKLVILLTTLGLIGLQGPPAGADGLRTPFKPCDLTSADFEEVKRDLYARVKAGDPIDKITGLFEWDVDLHYVEKYQRQMPLLFVLPSDEVDQFMSDGKFLFTQELTFFRQFCDRGHRNQDQWILAIGTDHKGLVHHFDLRLVYDDLNFSARNEPLNAERYLPGTGRYHYEGYYRTVPGMAVISLIDEHGCSASQIFDMLAGAGFVRAENKLEMYEPGGPKFPLIPHNTDNAIWRTFLVTKKKPPNADYFGWYPNIRGIEGVTLYDDSRIYVRYNRLTDEILEIY